MARLRPADTITRPGFTPPEPDLKLVISSNLDLLSRAIGKTPYVDLDIASHVQELNDPETSQEQKLALAKEIYQDIYSLLKDTRTLNSLGTQEKSHIQFFLSTLARKLSSLGLDIKALEQVIDQELVEDTEKFQVGNYIIINDPALAQDLRVVEGRDRILILDLNEELKSVLLRTPDHRKITVPKAWLADSSEVVEYPEVEKPAEDGKEGDWPIPKPGEPKSIMIDGQHLGDISTDDGQRFRVTTTKGRTAIIRGREGIAKKLENIFKK